VLVLRRGGELGYVVGCSLGGKSWDEEEEGKEEGEIEEERVAEWVYIGFYRCNHRQKHFVDIPVSKSVGDCVTLLYGDPSLNPSVFLSIKSSKKNQRHHTIATFQKST
jgi:hypothetical protein